MTQLIDRSAQPPAAALSDGLEGLALLPAWLTAAVQPEVVRAALARHVREFAAGDGRAGPRR